MAMHKRSAHRGRLVLTITVGSLIAAGSFWMVELLNRVDPRLDPDAFKGEPDYIVEKFSVVRMTETGQPRYLLSGAKLTHHPVDDTSEVDQPLLKNVAPGSPPVTIRAKTARIAHGENRVELLGAVDIDRPAFPDTAPMRLQTETLTVFPDEDRMHTDAPVRMTSGAAAVSGIGMQANNATRELQLKSRVQITYPPKTAR